MSTNAPDNDDEIRLDDEVYRRYFPRGKKGLITGSSFTLPRSIAPSPTPDPEISVNLARLTTPEETLRGAPPGMKIGVLRVRDIVETLGLRIRRAPEKDNRAHCVIEGVDSMDMCDRLAEITTPLQ